MQQSVFLFFLFFCFCFLFCFVFLRWRVQATYYQTKKGNKKQVCFPKVLVLMGSYTITFLRNYILPGLELGLGCCLSKIVIIQNDLKLFSYPRKTKILSMKTGGQVASYKALTTMKIHKCCMKIHKCCIMARWSLFVLISFGIRLDSIPSIG